MVETHTLAIRGSKSLLCVSTLFMCVCMGIACEVEKPKKQNKNHLKYATNNFVVLLVGHMHLLSEIHRFSPCMSLVCVCECACEKN